MPGRAFAAYGGVYILSALLWMWAVEGARPDRWDVDGVGGGAGGRGGDFVGAARGVMLGPGVFCSDEQHPLTTYADTSHLAFESHLSCGYAVEAQVSAGVGRQVSIGIDG
jgi:hypothetical protein